MDLLLLTIFFLNCRTYYLISYYLLDIVYRRTIETEVDVIFLKDSPFFLLSGSQGNGFITWILSWIRTGQQLQLQLFCVFKCLQGKSFLGLQLQVFLFHHDFIIKVLCPLSFQPDFWPQSHEFGHSPKGTLRRWIELTAMWLSSTSKCIMPNYVVIKSYSNFSLPKQCPLHCVRPLSAHAQIWQIP